MQENVPRLLTPHQQLLAYSQDKVFRANDKLRTKRLAESQGIAVPELYGVLATQHETEEVAGIVDGRESFVIKPAQGAGGEGVLVVAGRTTAAYRLAKSVSESIAVG